MPYTVIVLAGTAIGQTVDATIGPKSARVTLLSEAALRVELDDVWSIMSAVTKDGRAGIVCAGGLPA